MEELKPMTNQGFFSYVFALSKFKQADLLNFIQYCTLSIVPILILYYFIKKYGPRITYKNSSLYILSATLFSLLVFIVGIFFIDRIINFIPTLSGKYYDVINLTNISIILIFCLLTIRAGYMERMSVLLNRFGNWFTLDDYVAKLIGFKELRKFNIYDDEQNQFYYQDAFNKEKAAALAAGASEEKANERGYIVAAKLQKQKEYEKSTDASVVLSKNGNTGGSSSNTSSAVTTTNPAISQQYAAPAPLPTQGPKQNLPNYNNMYANTTNPLQNAASPGMSSEGMYVGDGGSGVPEPANGALGGGAFSTWP
jgi:hypothetical protein